MEVGLVLKAPLGVCVDLKMCSKCSARGCIRTPKSPPTYAKRSQDVFKVSLPISVLVPGCILSCIFISAADVQAGQFTQLVDFGDSLSDVGNLYNSTFGLAPGAPGYYDGHFSNGTIWVEKLATSLGVAVPTPSSGSSTGMDYAYGDATSGSGTTLVDGVVPVPNVETQVSTFTSMHSATSTQLFTVLGGANDLLNYITTPGSVTPVAAADTAADNIAASVRALYTDGARNILVANLPDLGLTPRFVNTSGQAAATGLAAQFNAELAIDLASISGSSTGLHLYNLNLFSLIDQVTASPSSYGLTDVKDQAYTGDNDFLGNGTINPNASTYLFWDSIHPTTTGHTLIAQAALAAIPEPVSASLLMLGSIGLLGSRRRRS